jgi:hypothetical protein
MPAGGVSGTRGYRNRGLGHFWFFANILPQLSVLGEQAPVGYRET